MKKAFKAVKDFIFRHFESLFLFFLLMALAMLAGPQIVQMDIFDRKIQPLEDFQNNAPRRILEQVEDVEPAVVAMNADEQLFAAGVRSDGTDIRPVYTPFTVRIKGMKGQPTDRVTLRDEGDFHASLRLEFQADEFEIVAGDWKEQKLKAKYGDAILGLTDANIQRLIEMIREPLLEDLKTDIG